MRVLVITPPAPVVTLDEAKAHLRLGGDDGGEDTLIAAMIAAATATIDGPDGWLGRAIGVQTLEARLDLGAWPQLISLSYPPISSIVSVTYLDANRQPVVADAGTYELIGNDVIAIGAPAWANAWSGAEALRVRFIAGYPEVPAPIRAAILLMVGDLYRFRETASPVQMSEVPMSTAPAALLAPYRVYS